MSLVSFFPLLSHRADAVAMAGYRALAQRAGERGQVSCPPLLARPAESTLALSL